MAQIWVIQVLMPLRKDRVVLLSSVVGAVVGIVANILLVKRLGAVGSALVLLVSELSGNAFSLIYAIRKESLSFPVSHFLAFLAGSVPYVLFCLIGQAVPGNNLGQLAVAGVGCVFFFMLFNGLVYRKTSISEFIRNSLKFGK